jgi:hypothetical protein
VSRVFPNQSHRLTVALLGGAASVMLHVLLFAPVLWGAAGHVKPHPDDQGGGPRSSVSNDAAAMMVTFIDEPNDAASKQGRLPEATASLLAAPNRFLLPVMPVPEIPIPRVIVLSDSDADEDTVIQPSGSDPGRAVMFGRYVGQISARIERAWMRPRTPIKSGRFTCSARIVQDKAGVVQEVELRNCNGDGGWQVSLARAIQSASPLPAPANPSVFAKTLTLEFSSDPFTSSGDPEGFEPAARTQAMVAIPNR